MLHAVQCFSFFQKPQEVKASKHEFLKKKNTEADQNINQKQYFFCNMAARMQIDLLFCISLLWSAFFPLSILEIVH